MFSVPGWNLSANLATQVDKPKPSDPSKEGKKAKKRRQKQDGQIQEGDVGEYFGKLGSEQTVKDTEAKEVKESEANGTNVPEGEETQEKRGKKRKRKNNKAGKEEEADGVEKAESKPEGTPATVDVSTAADVAAPKEGESKRDKKKRKKDQKPTDSQATSASTSNEISKAPAPVSLLPPEPKGLTPLQKSMRLKLASARFRHLNEALYTKPSEESLSLFKEDPTMFEDYHRGFAQQVEVWPENPVDSYVNTILARGKLRTKDPWKDKKRKDKKGKSNPNEEVDSTPNLLEKGLKPLPRNLKSHATIADLGCGTASLSHRLQPHLKSLNITLHSFDLSKPTGPSGPLVTVADISALPLPDNSVDVAIFCLALMGTNWLEFIDEAWRILRWKGELWIAEIKSRFGRVERRKAGQGPINSIGSLRKPDKKAARSRKGKDKPEEEGIQGSDDEKELAQAVDGQDGQEGTDVSSFVAALQKHGFVLDALPERQSDAVDLSNKMFVKLQFVKGASPSRGKNAKKEGESGSFGRGGLKMGIKGKKFTAITEDDEGDDEKDAKTLKPCLYKIR